MTVATGLALEPEIALPFPLVAWAKSWPVAVIVFAVNEPVLSRLTMAFAVPAVVGATFQPRMMVPLVVTGEPHTVKSEPGALVRCSCAAHDAVASTSRARILRGGTECGRKGWRFVERAIAEHNIIRSVSKKRQP